MTFHKMRTKLAAFGLALLMGLVPTGNIPTAYAAEEPVRQQEHGAQEGAKQEDTQKAVLAQRRVQAKDLTKKVKDQTFFIGTSLEGIQFDPEKDEVSFYKAIGDDGSEYQPHKAGSYTASYLVTPKDQEECYVVTRKIILTDTEGTAHVSENGGEQQKRDTDSEEEPEAKEGLDSKTNAELDSDAEPKKDAAPDSDSESKEDADPDSDSESKEDADPDSDSESKEDADSDSDSESKEDADSDSDSESDQETDTEKDSEDADKPQDTEKVKITISGKGETEESLSRLQKDIAEGKLMIVSAAGIAFESADSAVNLEKGDAVRYPDSLGGHEIHWFQINGETAYCLENSESTPFQVDGISSVLESNVDLQKVLYYGFGGKGDLTGEALSGKSREEKYVYTHIAVSYAYAGKTGVAGCTWEELQNTDAGAYIECLFRQEVPPSNGLSLSAASVDAIQEGDLQKTPKIRLEGNSRSSIELSVPEDVTCYNVTQNDSVTHGTIQINGGDSFYLSAKMNVTGQYDSGAMPGSLKEGWKVLVLSSREGKEDIGVFEARPADPVRFTVQWLGQAKISLLKKDRDTGSPLAGAVYAIYKDAQCKDRLMELPETDESGNATSESFDRGLKQVYVKEMKAPEHYLLDSNVYPVDVESGKEVEMTVYDVQEKNGQEDQPTETRITKTDASTGELLEGAVLQVMDQDGNLVEEWASTKEAHVIFGLPEGEYTLHEKQAPFQEGYVSAPDITFQVSEETGAEVEMKDGYSKMDLSVQDQSTGKELPGATLQLLDGQGNILKEWVTDGRPYRVEKLPVNAELILRETAAPKGYAISKEVKLIVTDTEEVQSIALKNARISEKMSKPGNAPASGNTSAPKTGDTFQMPALLLTAGVISLALLAVLLIRRIKRDDQEEA